MIAKTVYLKITKEKIAYILISQSATKVPDLNKMNF